MNRTTDQRSAGAGDANGIPMDMNDEVLGRPAELKLSIFVGNPRTLNMDRVEPKGR